jgi:hypothetical protein
MNATNGVGRHADRIQSLIPVASKSRIVQIVVAKPARIAGMQRIISNNPLDCRLSVSPEFPNLPINRAIRDNPVKIPGSEKDDDSGPHLL